MKNKKIILLLTLLMVVSLFLGSCAWFRQPEPERQPVPAPDLTPAPNPQPNPPAPRQPAPQEQPQGQPIPGAMDMAERVANISTDVEGVDRSVVVVISNIALIGITLERDETARRGDEAIKEEVAQRVEDREPSIANAYVSANPDIVKQLTDISHGIQRGEPISSFFEQITDVLRRLRADTGN